ncbi:arginine decarboxylase [Cysteiniphilum sp. JM-1]|uniref:arginine decarboxylase n=1 Tax=Cysteiniphilum sp. JM-1 TaxID=2610891 RepID=UPI001245595C|nr:arginine decarboxylase [Cysteiniphilum sp. JM-1]
MHNINSFNTRNTFQPYFSYDENNQLCVHYGQSFTQSKPLTEIIDKVLQKGGSKPCVLNFKHITEDRMLNLYQSFAKAMENYRYQGAYQLAYPIKVNPNAAVMETLKECAYKYDLPFNFEVGSKSELLSVLALAAKENNIICNGFKDKAFYELANLAAKLGYTVIMVLENVDELAVVKSLSYESAIYFKLGYRTKPFHEDLHSVKFGLSLKDILFVNNELKALNLSDKVVLLHGHIGSQLKQLSQVEKHINMMVCLYGNLLNDCKNLTMIDLGGGLGIDYEDTQNPRFQLPYYAETIVRTFSYFVDLFQLPHPTIITESGRAVTAISSVLIVSPLYQKAENEIVTQTSYDEALQAGWLNGEIDLADLVDSSSVSYLGDQNAQKLWLNFSLFQSLPDHWGIGQHFPLLPVTHYSEEESIDCQLFDISCDADGVFKDKEGNDYINLPCTEINDLAFMFVGAYQDMLSSKHNIIGRTTSVEVDFVTYDDCVLYVEQAEDYHALLCQYGHNPLQLSSRLQRLAYFHLTEELTDHEQLLLDSILSGNPYLQLADAEQVAYDFNQQIFNKI